MLKAVVHLDDLHAKTVWNQTNIADKKVEKVLAEEGRKMVYNAMYPIRQQPFVTRDGRGIVKQKEDEESSQSSHASQRQEERQVNHDSRRDLQQELVDSKRNQQAATMSRDANIKNSTVNIAQIIKDFKSTAVAIGASPELTNEVNEYLSLVEKQVLKSDPNIKLIKSNLRNASSLLDNYITETLQRPSKVVENWIDALFLQNINYKFNEEDINPQFLVKFPHERKEEQNNDKSEDEEQEENQEEEEKTKKISVHIPSDEKLKSLFLQAKKYTYANNSKKAMEIFKEALSRAIEVADKETESKILFEIGKIYDKNDYLAQALTSYNKSLETTQDISVKTKAHFSMAQIYDDVDQIEPAINHYMSSISYAGEIENLTAQTTSLTKIGNIYSDKYQKEAFNFLLEAEAIAAESKNSKTKGYVSSNIANAYNRFNEPENALKFYSNAIKEYQDAKSPDKIAINYKRAAEVMKDYNNPSKAKSLLKKALSKASQSDDMQLMQEIKELLTTM